MPSTKPAVPEEKAPEVLTEAQERAALAIQAMVTDVHAEMETTAQGNALDIVARIVDVLESDSATPTDLSAGQAIHAREILDVPIVVESITWQPSDYEEGLDFFAVVHGSELRTGKPVAVTCGGLVVVVTLYGMRKRGWLPATVILREAKQTAAGFKPLNVEVVSTGTDAEGKSF